VELVSLCAPFGRIESAKVMIDLKTGESKCFGFVRYSSIESAINAVFRLNGAATGGKRLMVRFASGQENTGNPTNAIRIKSLPVTFTEAAVREMFEVFGEIVKMELEIDQTTRRFRGCAKVEFRSKESAIEAVRHTNNLRIEGGWPLFVQYIESTPITIQSSLKK
jgi:RNA recognition motif-containing protein